MDKKKIITLLKCVKAGGISLQDAYEKLRHLPYEDLGFAKVDHHRLMRTGFPEVIFCQGKTIGQIVGIFKSLAAVHKTLLLTRADDKVYRKIKTINRHAVYNAEARTISVEGKKSKRSGLVSIVCAGTADIPVAEEAAATAEIIGSYVERIYDAGVAGLHRVLDHIDTLSASRCVVVIAGMDGVLPSVVGGLVSCPVIAVPTSVGYGANFNGIAPLLTMLNSCSPAVAVVNINNGFGAGYVAALINRMK